jgi:hypothetical protein
MDALSAALPSGLVALDFDGTLAAISPRPGDASPLGGAGQLLRDVRATGAALAIVTGRTVASLLRVSGFDAIPGIVIYGTHGAERWQAGRLRAPAPPAGLAELLEILRGVRASPTTSAGITSAEACPAEAGRAGYRAVTDVRAGPRGPARTP